MYQHDRADALSQRTHQIGADKNLVERVEGGTEKKQLYDADQPHDPGDALHYLHPGFLGDVGGQFCIVTSDNVKGNTGRSESALKGCR